VAKGQNRGAISWGRGKSSLISSGKGAYPGELRGGTQEESLFGGKRGTFAIRGGYTPKGKLSSTWERKELEHTLNERSPPSNKEDRSSEMNREKDSKQKKKTLEKNVFKIKEDTFRPYASRDGEDSYLTARNRKRGVAPEREKRKRIRKRRSLIFCS